MGCVVLGLVLGASACGSEANDASGSPQQRASAACPGERVPTAQKDRQFAPRPPVAVLSTSSGHQCAVLLSYCPPWVPNCAHTLMLTTPGKPLPVAPGEFVKMEFGAPVRSVDPFLERNCRPVQVRPVVRDRSRWRLALPQKFNDFDPACIHGPGQERAAALTFEVVLGPDGRFKAYEIHYGASVTPAS